MTTIIVAGDLCPKDRVARLFEEERYEEVFKEVKPVIEDSDYSIVNLEAPIVIGTGTPIKKSGPNLKCSNKVIGAIKYAGFKGVTLANNHLRDYGEDGVLNTLEELHRNSVDYVGAGSCLSDATMTKYVKAKDDTIAFINCCEHEFSLATTKTAGSNPLDIIGQYQTIKEAKKKADYVVVIVHGGIEMYQLPTPRMIKTYRFFIEAGADAVINHHQHCFSGFEYYQDKPIVYGLGNFCFDWEEKKDDIWHQGYMAKLFFDDGRVHITPIPYRQCDSSPSVQFTKPGNAEFEHRLYELCEIIADDVRISTEYEQFMGKTWRGYDILTPWENRYLYFLYKKRMLPRLISKKRLYSILNIVRCQSHQERFLNAIEVILE